MVLEVKGMCIPTVNMVLTGQNIRRLRIQAGLTVASLQKILGFSSPQAIFKWQRGDTLPTVDNLVILAAVFKVRVDDILVVTVDSALKI